MGIALLEVTSFAAPRGHSERSPDPHLFKRERDSQPHGRPAFPPNPARSHPNDIIGRRVLDFEMGSVVATSDDVMWTNYQLATALKETPGTAVSASAPSMKQRWMENKGKKRVTRMIRVHQRHRRRFLEATQISSINDASGYLVS